MLVTQVITKLYQSCLVAMASQTMVAGRKFSINGTPNSHDMLFEYTCQRTSQSQIRQQAFQPENMFVPQEAAILNHILGCTARWKRWKLFFHNQANVATHFSVSVHSKKLKFFTKWDMYILFKNLGRLWLANTELQGGFYMLQVISVDSSHFTQS